MNCRNIHDQLPDVAWASLQRRPRSRLISPSAANVPAPCNALRSTMSLLDEWKAPEPSAFWDVRMQARLREEQQKASRRDGCSGSAVPR